MIYSNDIKYLVILIDQKLNFHDHVHHMMKCDEHQELKFLISKCHTSKFVNKADNLRPNFAPLGLWPVVTIPDK